MLKHAILAIATLMTSSCVASSYASHRPHRARFSQPRMTMSDIERALTPHGEWLAHGEFGRVWRPYAMTVTWRPYTHGHWEDGTHGWTWISSWDWGFVPFHYGRWHRDDLQGWVWVAGEVWGPAWVAFRYDGHWVGWAPLPPGSRFRSGGYTGIDNSWWCFIERSAFGAAHLASVIFDLRYNPMLVRKTVVYRTYPDRVKRHAHRASPAKKKHRAHPAPSRSSSGKHSGKPVRSSYRNRSSDRSNRRSRSTYRAPTRAKPRVHKKPRRTVKHRTTPRYHKPKRSVSRPKPAHNYKKSEKKEEKKVSRRRLRRRSPKNR